MKGIYRGFADASADIYLFLSFPLLTDELSSIKGEVNIFSLPHLEDFDGAIIFGNSIDFGDTFQEINRSCKEAGIPTVSLGRKPEYGHHLTPDNKAGMELLCDHLKSKHNVGRVYYVAGSANNPDSNVRLEVIRDAFQNLTESDIFYTNWDLGAASDSVTQYLKSGRELPDAFMCANDGIAIFVAETFLNNGIKVPEDIVVTGFDDTYSSSVFDPTLTSVSQDFTNAGYKASRMILDLCDGKEVAKETLSDCILRVRESCGCTEYSSEADAARRDIGHKIFIERLIANNFDSKLNYLDAKLLSGMEFIDIYSSLSEFYGQNSGFEKGNMHILLEQDYENSVYDESIELRDSGYSDHMFDIFSMNDGKISFDPNFETRKLVPHIEDSSQENHVYIFCPLHDGERAMGYYVFRDIIDEIDKNNNLVRYEQRLNSIFIKYRKNLLANYLNNKLKIINETDPMTGVKNRTAYDAAVSKENSNIFNKTAEDFALVIFDINNLKSINDEFGHEYGDEYIIGSCKLLCHVFKHSPVFRIGGDEFVSILKGEDFEEKNSLLIELNDLINEMSKKDLPAWQKVSVAFGLSCFDPENDTSISDVFKRADTIMYENKKEFKGKADIR
ncbi:MAG: GGDEF domain-containing protein [Lachnospiraceae bacterium]|nr:GGDEF domain-containing protein [Lachnospiraceae bacterium]